MRILFFAPHSAIWVHAFPEALVAEALQQHGHDIAYVSCGGTFERYCVPMSAHGLNAHATPAARLAVCNLCRRYDGLLREEFGLRGPKLTEILTRESEIEVDSIIASTTRASMLALERDSVPVGRIALYQLMLRRKRIDLDFTDVEWQEYQVELRNTLYAWMAGKALLNQYKPDRVLVYNALYSVNRAICKLAEARGIPAYFLHAGGNLANRLQTLMLGRGDTFAYMPHIVSQWPRFVHVPCTPRLLSLVTEHYVELLRGRSVFVYSSTRRKERFDARAHFRVGNDQKLLIATMGSYDEEVAAELVGARQHGKRPAFQTQIDWVRAVLEFVSSRKDLFVIVRVHPREFPNRRDGVLSQHAQLLQSALSSLPRNAAVNWPADGISVYDLADQADVILNSWSSVGKEMSLLGIPVVIYSDELAFYPSDLNYIGTNREAYFSAIDEALRDGWDVERSRKAYRWAAFEFSHATVFIGDSYPEVEHPVRPLATKIMERLRRHMNADFKQRRDCRRRLPEMQAAAQITALIESGANSPVDHLDVNDIEQTGLAEETAALKKELRRLANALFPDPASRVSSRLYARLTDFTRRGSS